MKCGSKLPEDAKFCKYCGTSTDVERDIVANNGTTNSVQVQNIPAPAPTQTSATIPAPEPEPVATPAPTPAMAPMPSSRLLTEPAPAPEKAWAEQPQTQAPIQAPVMPNKAWTEQASPVQQPPIQKSEPTTSPIKGWTEPNPGHVKAWAEPSPTKVRPEPTPVQKTTAEESAYIKSPRSYEEFSRKLSGVYVDNEYHGGLARKNIGGEFIPASESIEGGKWGFVDISGKEIIPLVYDNATIFKDGFAIVSQNDKWGIINKKGDEIIPLMYDGVTFIGEGLAGVCLDGKWGYVDTKGKRVIPFKYSHAMPFENGMAGVCKNGKWGFIDKKDRIVIPFMYNDINQFDKHRNTNIKQYDTDIKTPGLLYRLTVGMSKAWAAALGEIALLLVMNYMLPDEKNSTFWSLSFITIVLSFVLLIIFIGAVRDSISIKKLDQNQ